MRELQLDVAISRMIDVPQKTRERFAQWILKNLDVWREFERLTLCVVSAGKTIGAKAIAERLRWEVEIEQRGEFKLCNTYVSYLARLFAVKWPEHAAVFNFKPVRGIEQ